MLPEDSVKEYSLGERSAGSKSLSFSLVIMCNVSLLAKWTRGLVFDNDWTAVIALGKLTAAKPPADIDHCRITMPAVE